MTEADVGADILVEPDIEPTFEPCIKPAPEHEPEDGVGAGAAMATALEPSLEPVADGANTAASAAAALPDPPSALASEITLDGESAAHRPSAVPAPSFVLKAERAARWRQPGVRFTLALASLLAATALAAQVAIAHRDLLAAMLPAARPLLQQACVSLGCQVGSYHHIESLTVESSGLVRIDNAPVYRLAVSLRNRGAVEVAAPALDLAVTDAQGQPIARRVLTMSDLGLPLQTLRAGSEVPVQAPLAIDGAVSGYTVEIFYP